MEINPDNAVLFRAGFVIINSTLVNTWFVMAVLVILSAFATMGISRSKKKSRWQTIMETMFIFVRSQVRQISGQDYAPIIPFLGTLLLFIFTSNIMEAVPLYHPPTSSLSTTAALAVCVFLAVPFFGIKKNGFLQFLHVYIEPSIFMMPFNLLGEITRTISLSVRLFGNIMSETLIASILLLIVPLFVPVFMQVFSLIIGTVQAYIFFTLASVYLGAAITVRENNSKRSEVKNNG
jgi:F-type H+-transporting ATPase subunit a